MSNSYIVSWLLTANYAVGLGGIAVTVVDDDADVNLLPDLLVARRK